MMLDESPADVTDPRHGASPPAGVRARGGSFAGRVVYGLLAVVATTLVLSVAGVPQRTVMLLAQAAMFTFVFAGAWPAGTPNRWRRNSVVWSAHFVFFAAAFILVSRWQGL